MTNPTIETEEAYERGYTACKMEAIDAIIAKLDAIDHVPQWVFDELTGVIADLTSVQPEREPAKFIRWMECKKTDKYISYKPHCKCSKCGNELLIEAINYCYMCGAKMEGCEQDETD